MKFIKKILNVGYWLFLAIIVCLALLLVGSALPITGNYRILTVLSGSMEPTLHTGSIVVIAPQSNYKIGDIITFGEIGKDKTPVTHRIKDVKIVDGGNVFITKGDANNAEDGSETPQSEVKGKALFSIPYLGFALNFVKQPMGFMIVIIVPAILIVWEEMKKIAAEIKKNKNKAEKKSDQTVSGIEKKDENQNV